jgi:hypothetical protein
MVQRQFTVELAAPRGPICRAAISATPSHIWANDAQCRAARPARETQRSTTRRSSWLARAA